MTCLGGFIGCLFELIGLCFSLLYLVVVWKWIASLECLVYKGVVDYVCFVGLTLGLFFVVLVIYLLF